jgi:tetratricopeptide (TPR) repeat protein
MPDVFVSFTRTGGHPELAVRVRDLLRRDGVDAFLDDTVQPGDGITKRLVEALRGSRLMVVVYSAAYNDRWACQWELIQAYLAGAAEGDPNSRLLVVNPEPGFGHIVSAVADSLYLTPDGLDRLPAAVRRKLAAVPAPMSAVWRGDRPRWLPSTVAGAADFVGRFPDLWRLHHALTAVDRPLTSETRSGPAAVVCGMAGIGKTSLVRAYAWLFGDSHRAGVLWTSVGGDGGLAEAKKRFDLQVRERARELGIPTSGEDAGRVAVLLGEHLNGLDGATLMVVDDLPSGVSRAELDAFVVPASRLRTVFLTREPGFTGEWRVDLAGLGAAEGLRMLSAARPVPPEDSAAAAFVVERLGGHPLALRGVADRLRHQVGLVSYATFGEVLRRTGPDEAVVAVVAESMLRVDSRVRVLVTLAGVLAAAPVPAGVLASMVRAVEPSPAAVGEALGRLHGLGFAYQDGELWQVHRLAVDAANRLGPPPVAAAALATAAATELATLVAEARHGETALLVRHAREIAGSAHLTGTGLPAALRRPVARYDERIGDPAGAAAEWQLVVGDHPDSAEDQVAAALASAANGEYGRAATAARHALDLGVDGELGVQARWALAAALDGLGDYAAADALWPGLDHATWRPELARRIAFDVSRARAMTARGRLTSARQVLEPRTHLPDGADDTVADQVNAARIEYARLLLLTSSEREGREMAAQVVAYYRDRGATTHARRMEAELVWAEAALALALFELRPDTSQWDEAERVVADLHERYPETAGPHSVFGLAAAVQHGLILVRLGKQAQCREVLAPALDRIRTELGERHPLHLRARFILALTHLQLDEHAEATEILHDTWRVQCEVIGPGHPDTLNTQFEYGVALRYTDGRRSAQVVEDVWRRLPGEIGRKNDLYGRVATARVLLPLLPPPLMRAFNRLERLRKRLSGG